MTEGPTPGPLDDIAAAVEGDREALTRVVRAVQPQVFRLAIRFFGDPHDAEDATQEALIQIVTKLDRFGGRSALSTWVHRVAVNKFLSMRRGRGEAMAMTFEEFDEDLASLPAASSRSSVAEAAEDQLLLEEVKIGCTLAMLLCLDRGHRMAFILGEIMELDHGTAADILDVSPSAYRKRLQRARADITGLMRARCGLFDESNPCRCRRRAPGAIDLGRIDPGELVLASSREQVRRFPAVLAEIRRLDEAERAGALYRSHAHAQSRQDLAGVVSALFDAEPDE